MWYIYGRNDEVIGYTQDVWYAAELKRAGFDVREQKQ